MSEVPELGEEFLAPLHRHFINLMCVDLGPAAIKERGPNGAVYNFSAFIVDICGSWRAITAGHIFRKLEEAVAKGADLKEWQIDDSIVSQSPKVYYPIPFDLGTDVLYLHHEGLDYATFALPALAVMALEKEGIRAIPESLWMADNYDEFSSWLLVGTPEQFADVSRERVGSKEHATIQLERVAQRPAGLEDARFERLWAKVHFESVVGQENGFKIEGMSGGPIFGLRPGVYSLPYDYRLIGIQSSWNNRDHVAFCPARPFLRALAAVLDHPLAESG